MAWRDKYGPMSRVQSTPSGSSARSQTVKRNASSESLKISVGREEPLPVPSNVRSNSTHPRAPRQVKEAVLDLSGQGLTSIPTSQLMGKNVVELDISANNIRLVPAAIAELSSLTRLSLSGNAIRCVGPQDFSGLPAELHRLGNLRELDLSECSIRYVPPAVWRLTSLAVLGLSGNRLRALPPEIGKLTLLRRLDLKRTEIASLPAEIAYCQELEELLLWGNIMESLPDTLPDLPRLRTLTVNYRHFCNAIDSYTGALLSRGQIKSEHIPLVVFEMPALEILDLEAVKINHLPDMYTFSLRELYAPNNDLRALPPSLLALEQLEVLDLSQNAFRHFPAELEQLSSLKTLLLNGNSFEELPALIGKLRNLERLELAGNRIRHLPPEIGSLGKLKSLGLAKNALQALPGEVGELNDLVTLVLSGNSLNKLPLSLHRLTGVVAAHSYHKLRKHGLWVDGNPLRQVPAEIWQTNKASQIFMYLRSLQFASADKPHQMKVVLLGDSGAGKTSLRYALASSSAGAVSQLTPTKVMDQVRWKTKNGIKFSLNDLGGDRVYTMLWPLFLDSGAFYLVIYDHSKYSSGKYYAALGQWLDLIFVHTSQAVIKVIGTHADCCSSVAVEAVERDIQQHLDDFRQRLENEIKELLDLESVEEGKSFMQISHQLQLRLKQLMTIKETLPLVLPKVRVVSSQDASGIQDLADELEHAAMNEGSFPWSYHHVPESWAALTKAIKQVGGIYLKWEDVETVCKRIGLKSDDLPACVRHLHAVGDVLWYHDKPKLSNLVFHKPLTLVSILADIFGHIPHEWFVHENKVIVSKADFSEDQLVLVRDLFLKRGQLSRPLLKCLWFYQKLDCKAFEILKDLLPCFNICYGVSEKEVPSGKEVPPAILVVPWYNTDSVFDDLENHWPKQPLEDEKETCLELFFPFTLPAGLFESVSAHLNKMFTSRVDHRDRVYAETDSAKVLISNENSRNTFSICCRASTVAGITAVLEEVSEEIDMVLCQYPGLYHYWQPQAPS